MLKNLIKTHCRASWIGVFAKFGKSINRYYENLNYAYETNGESRVLKVIGATKPKIILDVGAFQGTWARVAVENCPQAQIFSVEPVPHAFEILERNASALKNVQVFRYLFGAENKTVSINYFPGGASHLSSVYEFPHKEKPRTTEVAQIRGDDFIKEAKIDFVDFLKIDTEGAELEVLKGFSEALKQKKIAVIQFEYGKINIISHALLRDFYVLLNSYGYEVGKIYPTCVDFSDYNLDKEDFIGPNFIAVLKENSQLIAALK